MPRGVDAYDIEIARRIRVLRLARNMPQTTLADRLGVTYQQVQKYETGANRIGAGRLLRIAEILEVPAASLIGAADRECKGERDVLALLNTNNAVRLLEAYSRIDNRFVQLALIRLARGLAERHGRSPDGAQRNPRRRPGI